MSLGVSERGDRQNGITGEVTSGKAEGQVREMHMRGRDATKQAGEVTGKAMGAKGVRVWVQGNSGRAGMETSNKTAGRGT